MNDDYLLGYFYESTSIPLVMCDSDGKALFSYPDSISSTLTPEFLENRIKDFETQHLDQEHPLIQMIPSAFLLGIIKIYDEGFLFMGPVSSIQVKQKEILEFCHIAVQPDRILEFSTLINRIPIMHYRQFVSSVAIVLKLCTGLITHLEDIVLYNATPVKFDPHARLSNQVFDRQECDILHTAYDFEQGMQAAVEAGDVSRLKSIVLQPLTGRVGQMSSDLLQQEKYTFVSAATMISRAAVHGGMNYEAACSLADIYCQQMDSMQRVQDITTLIYQMSLDFCQRVSESHAIPGLSRPVRESINYITNHLHDDIRIDDISNHTGFCNKSISQKFHAQTGYTIPVFIHQEKMREAAQLLKFSTHSISQISSYFHYSSQSYFTRIFREIHGMTPNQYRKQFQRI